MFIIINKCKYLMMLSGRPLIDTYSASAVTKLQSQEQSQVSISRTIKYLRYKETSDHKTNFLTAKVIEPRSSHLLQRYLSFDILSHSLGTTLSEFFAIVKSSPGTRLLIRSFYLFYIYNIYIITYTSNTSLQDRPYP